jgi:hypothetical protein
VGDGSVGTQPAWQNRPTVGPRPGGAAAQENVARNESGSWSVAESPV